MSRLTGQGRTRPPLRGLLAAVVLCGISTAAADPDLPGAAANVESIPSGSLVIPMDNSKQNLVAPFNLKAYGLVNHLLWNNVPVKWAIAAGKAKDGIDFSGTAERVLPTAVAAGPLDFRGGPFIVTPEWASFALSLASSYGSQVAVYRLTAGTTADVRYTLTQKRKIAALDDGGNADIHTTILDEAGFVLGTHYDVILATTLLTVNANSCYTMVSEPHFGETAPNSDPQAQAVRAFLNSGGNFLAQCAGLITYENNPTHGHFLTTLGVDSNNLNETLTYPNADLSYSQFEGVLIDPGGSERDFRLAAGSALHNNGHAHAQNTPTTNTWAATAAKLTGGIGSIVYYLGGHDFAGSTIGEVNGRRMYLNAVMTPGARPGNCGLDFTPDVSLLRDIAGTVREDINGDSNLGDAVAASGVRVRLYQDANASGTINAGDVFLAETTTSAAGAYSFTVNSGATGNLYLVAVDSKTVAPSVGFNAGSTQGDVWAEETYGDDVSTAALDLGSRFGGRSGGTSDNVSATDSSPTASTYEHVARVNVAAASVTGVDFAFSFNVVVNVLAGDATDHDTSANRTVQGSPRQFIQNGNAIAGANAMRFVPVVATNASSGPHAWWRLTITTLLPAITNAGTAFDGTAYASSNGTTLRNDNAAQLGTGGTAGVDALALGKLDPELEIVPSGNRAIGLDLQANNATARGVALYDFGNASNSDTQTNIRVGNFTGTLIENCVIGTTASSFTDPAPTSEADGIRIVGGDNGTIQNNLIGFNGGSGVGCAAGSNGWQITGNEVRGNNTDSATLAGIRLNGSTTATVRGNLLAQNRAPGLDMPTSTGSHTIENNSVTGNGLGQSVTPGIRITGNSSVIDRNVLTQNYGAGVMVTSSATLNRITRNSIDANGTILGGGGGPVTNQIGIDLLAAANNQNTGTSPFVTANDATDIDAGGNTLLNFPVLSSAASGGGQTIVNGTYTGAASTTFTLEFFSSATADPSGNGEGTTYIGSDTVTTSGAGTVNFTTTLAVSLPVGRIVTATATNPTANTSEFSGGVAVGFARSIVKRAFQLDGTPIPDGSTGPAGLPVRFLLYIDNPGAIATDVSIQDVLGPTFAYVAGSIRIDNSLVSATVCPGGTCNEATILAQVVGSPNVCGPCSDAVGGDVVSFAGTTLDAGNGSVAGNLQLDIPAGRVFALVFTVMLQ